RRAFQIQRGDFVPGPLRDPGGDRLFLEQARRGRPRGAVRLAEGSLWRLVAGGPDRPSGDVAGPGSRKVATGHQGVSSNEEVRHRGTQAGVRAEVTRASDQAPSRAPQRNGRAREKGPLPWPMSMDLSFRCRSET